MAAKATPRPSVKRASDEEVDEEEFAPAKRAKVGSAEEQLEDLGRPATLEELEPGAPVLYFDTRRGSIHDAFPEVDQFWVADDESGEVVRDEAGNIVDFASSELLLLAVSTEKLLADLAAQAQPQDVLRGGVLLLGVEKHMVKVLGHFGLPSFEHRQTPQQLLAYPCPDCEESSILQQANSAVYEELRALGKRLRKDIRVATRAFNLKQALRKLGPELRRLKDHFILASVHLPFGEEEIRSARTASEAQKRKEVFNQIDLCVTAPGLEDPLEEQPDKETAARSSLGETCGIEVSDVIWKKEVQVALRAKLGVELLPLQYCDANGVDIFTIIIPDDALVTTIKGILCFSESPTADYLKKNQDEISEPPKALVARSNSAPSTEAAPDKGKADSKSTEVEEKVQGKTVREWEAEQDQFEDLPKLPAGWIRIKSRTSGKVYFWHRETQRASFELPLPEGWTKQTSKSTGKVYYWNQKRRSSTFEPPTE